MKTNEIDDKALLEAAQLTAYALGELEGAEKEATAARVAQDPAARAFVEATRATAAELQKDLKSELTNHAAVAARTEAPRAAAPASAGPSRRRYWLLGLGTAAAALLLVGLIVGPVREQARLAAPDAQASASGHNAKTELKAALAIEYPRPAMIGTPTSPPPGARLDPALARQNAPVATVTTTSPIADSSLGYNQYGPATTLPEPLLPPDADNGTNAFAHIVDNAFLRPTDHPLSTFSIDVDTGSYSLIRSFLTQQGQLPPPDAVRIEEMLNYFDYTYEPPTDERPFATRVEIAPCPWAPEHRLAKIGLKGREVHRDQRPLSNLVFLLDVSGSMSASNKLPLVQQGLSLLVQQLTEGDYVSIVVYAGAAGAVLPPTSGDQKQVILNSLNRLSAGGSTNGGQGIRLAYTLARQHFVQGGCNRVILCTDGDFNVGTTGQGDLVRLIEKEAKSGVFLSIFGFGMGNYKDATLEQLADKGNGNYGYIDTLSEAQKIFVDQMSGTLVTIAKDVKIQVEFNPAIVGAYRLIGYENRMLRKEDFNDDTKDAGEIGAGHTVTALYEIVPAGQAIPAAPGVDPLKYQAPTQEAPAASSGEMMTVKLRYKEPDGETSQLLEFPITDEGRTLGKSTPDFRFAAAVAAFGMILRDSPYKGVSTPDFVAELAGEGLGDDAHGYRAEFVTLVQRAATLLAQRDARGQVHVIQPGDTLGAIALRYLGSSDPRTVKRLTDENPGLDPLKLQVGHKLRIPTR